METIFREDEIVKILFSKNANFDDFLIREDFVNKNRQSFHYFNWCLINLHNFQIDKMRQEALETINRMLIIEGKSVSMKYFTKLSKEYFCDLLNDKNYNEFLEIIITGQVALIEILYPKIWPDFYQENGLFSFNKNIIIRFIIKLNNSFDQNNSFNFLKNVNDIIMEYYKNGVQESLLSFIESMLDDNENLDLVMKSLYGISTWVNLDLFFEHEKILDFVKSQLNSNIDYFFGFFNKMVLRKFDDAEQKIYFLKKIDIIDSLYILMEEDIEKTQKVVKLMDKIFDGLYFTSYISQYIHQIISCYVLSENKNNKFSIHKLVSLFKNNQYIKLHDVIDDLFFWLKKEFDNPSMRQDIVFSNIISLMLILDNNYFDLEKDIFDRLDIKEDSKKGLYILKLIYILITGNQNVMLRAFAIKYFDYVLNDDQIIDKYYANMLCFYSELCIIENKNDAYINIFNCLYKCLFVIPFEELCSNEISSYPDFCHIIYKIIILCINYLLERPDLIDILELLTSLWNDLINKSIDVILEKIQGQQKVEYSKRITNLINNIELNEIKPYQLKPIIQTSKYYIGDIHQFMMELKQRITNDNVNIFITTVIELFGVNSIELFFDFIQDIHFSKENKSIYLAFSKLRFTKQIDEREMFVVNQMIDFIKIIQMNQKQIIEQDKGDARIIISNLVLFFIPIISILRQQHEIIQFFNNFLNLLSSDALEYILKYYLENDTELEESFYCTFKMLKFVNDENIISIILNFHFSLFMKDYKIFIEKFKQIESHFDKKFKNIYFELMNDFTDYNVKMFVEYLNKINH